MSDNPLQAIFSSRTVVRLLTLFLMNPERSFYQQELTEKSESTLRPVQVALGKLEAARLISRTPRGKQVYYQAITSNPVFVDLQALFAKSFALRDVLAEALQPLAEHIELAFVYGSSASGEQGPGSDVDLLIVGSVGRKQLAEALAHAQSSLGREVNVSLYTAMRLRDAITGSDPFVLNVTAGPRIWIAGDDDDLERVAR